MMTARSLVLLLAVTLMSLPVWAGTQNATVRGTVFAGGSEVPSATVRLINAGIGFSQTQVTGSDGSYIFNNVPPAENYLLSVEKTAFATQVRSGLDVHVYDDVLLLPPFLLESTVQESAQA